MHKKELQTIRLWNPLFPKTYERDHDGHVANYPTSLSASEIVSYQEKILAAIDQLKHPDEGERGLAIYLDPEVLAEKVYSIHPSVEEWDNQLWGITEIQTHDSLDEEEYRYLVEMLEGQFADGWGEKLEQRPIVIPEGELYLSFWTLGDGFFIKLEEEMLRELSESTGLSIK